MSDKKARIEVIAGLKEMIRSWLDENYPDLPETDRMQMAESMDITLIEKKKAECMKTIYELNQAVRLSFIEMQFIKKVRRLGICLLDLNVANDSLPLVLLRRFCTVSQEMVNALYTMDEMVSGK